MEGRHHTPPSLATKSKPTTTQSTSKLNQIFVLTCIVSFFLQLFGSIISWTSSDPEVFLLAPQALRRLQTKSFEAIEPNVGDLSIPERLQYGTPKHHGRLRVLVGILTADFLNDQAYRKRHRSLFKLWNDPRVCALNQFKELPIDERYRCELIYTFVMSGNPDASPELVDDSRPMFATKPIKGNSPDLNDPDTTLLNIRENMNEGKSQTWMKAGSEIAEEYNLDYVVKCDADSLLHLHEFFEFAYVHLPPAPYNKHIYAGALRDKAYWPKHDTEEKRNRFESYFGNNFEGVHLYVAGQFYIMSTDLAKFVGQEAHANKCSYCEGHEDHDISAMAFHSPDPIKLLVIGRIHRFWEHPVKGVPRWRRIWARESARMQGVPFEDKMFFTNSSLSDVLIKDRAKPYSAEVVEFKLSDA